MRIRLSFVSAVAVLLLSGSAAAQVIPIKTAPVAEGDQFTFLPAANRGMANVTIALPDSLLDPFNNPATGARIRRSYAFGAMTSYVISRNSGDGATLPAGAIVRSKDGSLFAGVAAALQRLSPGGRGGGSVFPEREQFVVPGSQVRTAETNQYVYTMLGRSFGSGLTVGASMAWSNLDGIDGVDQLYAQSRSVDQRGDVVGLRAGVLKDWATGRSIEAVVAHNRSSTAHHVQYEDLQWNPTTHGVQVLTRSAHNYDRTHLWAAQVNYVQPFVDSTWRIGAVVTANRTTHPTIPALGLMTLARDPGQSAAFNAGVGVSRRLSGLTYAADAVYEPIRARGIDGSNDNRYRFANGILRAGVRRAFSLTPGTAEVQLGIQAHSIGYTLDQRDAVQPLTSPRRSRERWTEWVHAIGLGYSTAQFQARYQWRLTSGVERLGILQPQGIAFGPLDAVVPGPFPFQQQLSMIPIRVTTQQFSVTVPLR